MSLREAPGALLRGGEPAAEEPYSETVSSSRVIVVCAAAAAAALSLPLPWVRAGLSGTPVIYRGTDLLGLTLPFALVAVIAVAAAVSARLAERPEALVIATVASGLMVAAAGLLILVL